MDGEKGKSQKASLNHALSKFAEGEINIPFHVIEQFEYREVKEFLLVGVDSSEGIVSGKTRRAERIKQKTQKVRRGAKMKSLKMNDWEKGTRKA
jgi:hypothetical protein